MKLLIQCDDYGITKGQAAGAIEGIKNGVIKNTGFFVNMPWSEEVFKMIQPYLSDIAFGLDLNLSTGSPVSNSKDIPSLVQTNSEFLTSSMHRQLDKENNDNCHVNYKDAYKELKAQIEKYIDLVGKKPDYLHAHAYIGESITNASIDLSKEYNIPYSMQLIKEENMFTPEMSWYMEMETRNQKDIDVIDYIVNDKLDILDKDMVFLVTHGGYVDAELYKLSSFNDIRAKDLEMLTSNIVIEWIEDNNIELITYNSFKQDKS